jgi:hypothetical protein
MTRWTSAPRRRAEDDVVVADHERCAATFVEGQPLCIVRVDPGEGAKSSDQVVILSMPVSDRLVRVMPFSPCQLGAMPLARCFRPSCGCDLQRNPLLIR